MPGYSEEFIEETRALWSKRSGRQLTAEEARRVAQNVTGFFKVLQEWRARQQSQEDTSGTVRLPEEGSDVDG